MIICALGWMAWLARPARYRLLAEARAHVVTTQQAAEGTAASETPNAWRETGGNSGGARGADASASSWGVG